LIKYRDRSDIIASILRIAANAPTNGFATNSKIMYGAYLSYAQLKEYLSMLVPAGMLERDPITDSYRITSKGTAFLNAYDRIQELLKVEEEEEDKKPQLKYQY
jgi:predicted transcriptional regulator